MARSSASITSVEPLDRHGAGVDRLAPRRLLVEARDVHVAIGGQQQRARDRRRRHHQELGAASCAFGLQREALMHAEAMLLVDDRKREIAERDVVLEQRMRADDDVDLARGERGQDRVARAALLAAGEERDATPGRRGERLMVA